MALTDQSDLFASVHEDGMNKLIGHVMRKRPSLFNYGTEWVAADWRNRLCERPDVADEVLARGNPVVTVEQPVPILGTGGLYALDFSAQLSDLRIDLHPSDVGVPEELGGQLQPQRFALSAKVCAGLGCPSDRDLEQFPPAPQPPIKLVHEDDRPNDERPNDERQKPERVIVLPTERIQCCCLELFVVGHVELVGVSGHERIELKVDGLELIDLEPPCLEDNLECYLRLLLHYVVLPRLMIAVPVFLFHILDGLAAITLSASSTVPHNPAVEDDQLKIFVNVEVGP